MVSVSAIALVDPVIEFFIIKIDTKGKTNIADDFGDIVAYYVGF